MSIRRTQRITVVGAALGGLLAALSLVPAHAAGAGAPKGWESDALGLTAAQRVSQGEGVTVAVVDTGVRADHPSVKGRVTTGPDYRGDGMDPKSSEWGDHGTAMASDVLKVAPKAKILSVRVTSDKDTGDTGDIDEERGRSTLAQGVAYAADHGADVISLSLGTGEVQDYRDGQASAAIGYAVSNGVTVLAGAGNGGDELNQASFPGGSASAISVAATKPGGGRAGFSTVHAYNAVAAPGVDIISASHTGGFKAVNGTSPATALASGVVALMLAQNPKLTSAQVRSILTRTAQRPTGGPNALLGYGQINALAAVKAAASPPEDGTAPVAYRGKRHFADPVGTPKTTHPEMEQGPWIAGLSAVGVGLLLLLGGSLLVLSGRRRRAARTGGMATPPRPGSFPASSR